MINVYRYAGIDCVTPVIINRELEREDSREVVFIVPEFAKAQVEREILSRLEESSRKRGASIRSEGRNIPVGSSFVAGDVLSFITLSSAILEAAGYEYGGAGSDVALRCAIYSVLANYKDDFKTFGKLTSRFEYINMLIDLLGDFTRYGIGVAQLEEAIANSSAYSAEYKSKLEDIKLMMESIGKINDQYGMSFLKNRIEAASQVLMQVSSDKLNNRRFSGLRKLLSSRFVFIGFGSGRNLTPQEYLLVNLLSEKGADITFYVLSTDKAPLSEKNLYKVGNEFTDRMKARGAGIHDLEREDRDETRFADLIEPFALDSAYEGEMTDRIRLAAISGADNQLGYVFSEIIRLTRYEGYRYRDIRIVCCDDDLSSRMRSNAELFGLDVFIDRRIELWSTLVPVFAETVLELPVHNYKISDVLRAMRCGLVKVPPVIVDMFDNYCRRMNITDGKRLFKSSVYLKDPKNEISLPDAYEDIKPGQLIDEGTFYWNYIVQSKLMPLRKAADAIAEEKLLSRKAMLLRDLLIDHRDDVELLSGEQQNAKESEAAAALVRGFSEVMNLLTLFTHEMNDVPIEQRAFISLIRTDMKNRIEGTIPLKVDSIEITTPDRAFVTPCKVMFILGASRENFPHKKGSEGLLSTGELRNLSKSVTDCELPDKNEARSKEEFVTCCLTLGTVTDRLYMIHNADKNFTSSVYDYLMGAADPGRFVSGFRTPVTGVYRKRNHVFTESAVDSDIMEQLLVLSDGAKGMNLSVSALEEFNACHLKYMLNRVLYVRMRDDNTEVDSRAYGTLIHKMYELGLSEMGSEDFTSNAEELLENEELYEKKADDVFEQAVLAENIPGTVDEDGDSVKINKEFDVDTGVKLRRMFKLTFKGILSDILKTGFIPAGYEAQIGKTSTDGKGREITLSLEDKELEDETGLKIRFNGFIDRFDLKSSEQGDEGLRVIDYKSGDKKIKTAELFNGIQIQLPLYTRALCAGYGIDPAGCDYGYFNVGLRTGSGKKPLTFEPKTAKAGSEYSDEDIKLALDYSNHIVKTSVNDIKAGKADALVSPGYHYCGFCPYAGACGNVPSRPVDRLGNRNPGDVYSGYLEKAAMKTGGQSQDLDGKPNRKCMNEAYKIMMRERLGMNKDKTGGEE